MCRMLDSEQLFADGSDADDAGRESWAWLSKSCTSLLSGLREQTTEATSDGGPAGREKCSLRFHDTNHPEALSWLSAGQLAHPLQQLPAARVDCEDGEQLLQLSVCDLYYAAVGDAGR